MHAYDAIDWRIVHAIATRHLDDFEHFARAVDAASGAEGRPGAGKRDQEGL